MYIFILPLFLIIVSRLANSKGSASLLQPLCLLHLRHSPYSRSNPGCRLMKDAITGRSLFFLHTSCPLFAYYVSLLWHDLYVWGLSRNDYDDCDENNALSLQPNNGNELYSKLHFLLHIQIMWPTQSWRFHLF